MASAASPASSERSCAPGKERQRPEPDRRSLQRTCKGNAAMRRTNTPGSDPGLEASLHQTVSQSDEEPLHKTGPSEFCYPGRLLPESIAGRPSLQRHLRRSHLRRLGPPAHELTPCLVDEASYFYPGASIRWNNS